MRFYVRARPVGITLIGWNYPSIFDVDLPFMRKIVKVPSPSGGKNIEMQIYIPGSSFKGALRSAASRVASSYGFTSCGQVEPSLIEVAHRKYGVCDVCKVFGYPGNSTASPITVSDLNPVNDVRTFNVTRTRIEDRSLKVAEGSLYTYEHIDDRVEFRGYIQISLRDPNTVGLILLALAELRLGRIGRSSHFDFMVEESIELKQVLSGSRWASLLEDLGRWLWIGVD